MESQKSPDPIDDSEIKIYKSMDEDDILLFNLNTLSSIKKDQKLMERGHFLCVDDRYFKIFRRYFTGDNRQKACLKTLEIIKKTEVRVNYLLNRNYEFNLNKTNIIEENKYCSVEEKNIREEHEKIRSLINRYYVVLSKAQIGVQNIKQTYNENFTKNFFETSKTKIHDILNNIVKSFDF